jgi:hypothetical protein
MGYLGMFAGALVLFQITQIPVVQTYWLLALAYLFSGRWPTGVPPAWRSGRAESWGSAAELRAKRAAGAAGGGTRPSGWSWGGKPRGVPTPAPQSAGAAGATSDSRTRSTTPKRKRKRRR